MGKASFMHFGRIFRFARESEGGRSTNFIVRFLRPSFFISRLNRDRIPAGPRLSARGAPSPHSRSRSEPGLISGPSLHGACRRGDAALPRDCGCYDNLLNELRCDAMGGGEEEEVEIATAAEQERTILSPISTSFMMFGRARLPPSPLPPLPPAFHSLPDFFFRVFAEEDARDSERTTTCGSDDTTIE